MIKIFDSNYYEREIILDDEIQQLMLNMYVEISNICDFVPEVNFLDDVNQDTFDHVLYHIEHFGKDLQGYNELIELLEFI